eukprot:749369-Hanusia_phi.AAC.1
MIQPRAYTHPLDDAPGMRRDEGHLVGMPHGTVSLAAARAGVVTRRHRRGPGPGLGTRAARHAAARRCGRPGSAASGPGRPALGQADWQAEWQPGLFKVELSSLPGQCKPPTESSR